MGATGPTLLLLLRRVGWLAECRAQWLAGLLVLWVVNRRSPTCGCP